MVRRGTAGRTAHRTAGRRTTVAWQSQELTPRGQHRSRPIRPRGRHFHSWASDLDTSRATAGLAAYAKENNLGQGGGVDKVSISAKRSSHQWQPCQSMQAVEVPSAAKIPRVAARGCRTPLAPRRAHRPRRFSPPQRLFAVDHIARPLPPRFRVLANIKCVPAGKDKKPSLLTLFVFCLLHL